MKHTKEKIRSTVLDILFRTDAVAYYPNQFNALCVGVGEIFGQSGDRSQERNYGSVQSGSSHLSDDDGELLVEVFWDLFREGIISLGIDAANPEFPHFQLHSDYTGKDRSQVQ